MTSHDVMHTAWKVYTELYVQCQTPVMSYWRIWYDKILFYWNWISTWWQGSVDLYKNRQETAQKEKQYTKHYKNN